MSIVFIINNKNNRLSKALLALEQYFRQSDKGKVEFLVTEKKEHAIQLARQATETGCKYLIAVGGDGTLHEVINGVMQSDMPATKHPAIGLLPCGSANDFARTVGVSGSIDELLQLIQSGAVRKIDLGQIRLKQTGETRCFINIAGIGLGAEVVQSLEHSSGLLGPGFNYFKHIIRGFLRYRKKEVHCTGSSWEWKGGLLQMAIANGRYFGNAICIAPDANISDGQFQVAVFGDLSIWDYLKNLGKLKKGVKISHPQVSYYNIREVLLHSKDPCSIEADGEFVGQLPATIRVLPGAISFLMPADRR
ncbi:diacylglycerol/lipid kinase family protein [Robiginitalea sp. IMCC43444]|uniref:diacylglycerol/lipid kinase family protein n=1 Tax=Robiginitalea sp. IMCC43444 TaxID=3459121 RepID=UPI004041E962